MSESTEQSAGGTEHNYISREILRPEHPNGEKYRFNCCIHDDVWRTEENKSVCKNCGHDWSETLDIDKTDTDRREVSGE